MRAVAVGEAAVAAAAFAGGRAGAAALAALHLGFAAVAAALRARSASCGCFGEATPVDGTHVVANLVVAAVALGAAADGIVPSLAAALGRHTGGRRALRGRRRRPRCRRDRLPHRAPRRPRRRPPGALDVSVVVTLLAFVVGVLVVLVVGLLRSHAAVLRRLHELDTGVADRPRGVPASAPTGRPAADIVGRRPWRRAPSRCASSAPPTTPSSPSCRRRA